MANYRSFRPNTSTTKLLHSSLSFAAVYTFNTSGNLKSSCALSDHLCLGYHLGLIMFGFHSIIRPIYPSDHHTCPAQLILILFTVSIRVDVSYKSSDSSLFFISNFLSLFFFISMIFLDIFLTKDSLPFFSRFFVAETSHKLVWLQLCITLFLSFLILILIQIVASIQYSVCSLRWTIVSALYSY